MQHSLLGQTTQARPGIVRDYVHNVYPFLGVDWGGKTFVGAVVPFGMVKLGPDMESFDSRPSSFGYMSGGRILGFSHLHLSGASGKYGNILVAPVTGPLDLADIKSPRIEEVNHPGYYATTLTRYNIRAELTATRRVGFHRYTFPAAQQSHLTINIDHCLNKGTGSESQRFLGGQVRLLSGHEAEGMGRYTGGWNKGGEYRVYFYIVLDTPSTSAQTWSGNTLTSDKEVSVDGDRPIGATFNFRTHVRARLCRQRWASPLSAQSRRGRTYNARLPHGTLMLSVRPLWITGTRLCPGSNSVAKRIQRGFSFIPRCITPCSCHPIAPARIPAGNRPSLTTTTITLIWDTYRSSGPLLTLIAPDRQRDLIRSLIDIYRHEGYMPDGRSGNVTGRTQGGSNADLVIADAYVKGMTGIDYPTAFEAMLKNASVPPANPQKEGRGGILDYNAKGYVTLADERSGSRTVEYAYNDFAIAEVACGLNRPAEAKLFAARAHNWEHLWDKDLTVEGFKGFLRPRNPDGTWAEPYHLIRGTWPDFLYEGDIWTYSLYAPQDVRKLIAMAGGEQMFVNRLDYIFYRQHFDVTNEPGFLIPVLYNWAGKPDHSAEIITELLEKAFTDQRTGIPGNDDSGAMSSWFIFNSLGFYPNAGQDIYLIGTPSFPEADITLAHGKTLRIIARNMDSEHINRFIQSATLNGKPLETSWFRHKQIADGGTLVFTLGSAPGKWGTTNPPPSMSDAVSPLCAAAQP
jgi:putative alpha-1,2-mannosidase